MGDTSAFPTIHDVLYSGDNITSYVSAGTIKAGMVVAFAATGVALSVVPATQATAFPVGVALYDASSGEYVAVAGNECIVYVCEGAGGTAEAGELLMVYGTTTTGTVCVYDPMNQAHAATILVPGASGHTFGQAQEAVVANSTFRIKIDMQAPHVTAG